MAESIDHPYSLAYAYWGVGHAYLRAGEFDKAIEVLQRGLSICRDWHITVWVPRYACDLGSAYAHSGRLDDALPLLEEAVEKADDMKFAVHESSLVAALSEGYLLAGRAGDAARSAQRALDLARAHQERGHEAWIHRLLGEMESCSDPVNVEMAKQQFRRSLELAQDLGMQPLAAQCHQALAKLN